MSCSQYPVDIAIIGGGIAGLWTLARIRQLGYQAILLEADKLGCEQSCASQGIIHGGTKYALTGKLTHSSQSIQQMPERWKKCLQGVGEVDLSNSKKLSDFQYLWSNKSLAARLTGFFASKVMSSRMSHLSNKDFMPPFDSANFNGELYQLDEPVLDSQSVIENLRVQFQKFIIQFKVDNLSFIENTDTKNSASKNSDMLISNNNNLLLISAKNIILTAGSANEKLLALLQLNHRKMQRRPLLMPMLKAKKSILPQIYAHCLGSSALPKMTITSHLLDNEIVWYLGGDIAEKGIHRTIIEQVKCAKEELQSLMPWMDFSSCQWSALAIDRAEPQMPDASRPSDPAVYRDNNIISAWPVKLAMVPLMVDKIIAELAQIAQPATGENTPEPLLMDLTDRLEMAQTTLLPWEKIDKWIK
ncbi:MAG: FAD-dependent oxidoreductase [Pseudomonadota bacterium]